MTPDQMEALIRRQAAEIGQLRATVERLQAENAVLRAERDEARAERDALRLDLVELRRQHADLKQQVSGLLIAIQNGDDRASPQGRTSTNGRAPPGSADHDRRYRAPAPGRHRPAGCGNDPACGRIHVRHTTTHRRRVRCVQPGRRSADARRARCHPRRDGSTQGGGGRQRWRRCSSDWAWCSCDTPRQIAPRTPAGWRPREECAGRPPRGDRARRQARSRRAGHRTWWQSSGTPREGAHKRPDASTPGNRRRRESRIRTLVTEVRPRSPAAQRPSPCPMALIRSWWSPVMRPRPPAIPPAARAGGARACDPAASAAPGCRSAAGCGHRSMPAGCAAGAGGSAG
jgi:hypothetical protein